MLFVPCWLACISDVKDEENAATVASWKCRHQQAAIMWFYWLFVCNETRIVSTHVLLMEHMSTRVCICVSVQWWGDVGRRQKVLGGKHMSSFSLSDQNILGEQSAKWMISIKYLPFLYLQPPNVRHSLTHAGDEGLINVSYHPCWV